MIGSEGLGKGNLSMMTQERASPLTSTPSQKVAVPRRTALPNWRNLANKIDLDSSPCTSRGNFNKFFNFSATRLKALWLVNKKKDRPWQALMIGITLSSKLS